jgi:hypothetical protein
MTGTGDSRAESADDGARDVGQVDLRESLPLIIAEWDRLSTEEPWHVHPSRHGADALHETIGAVLDVAAWSGSGAAAHERLVRAAAAHGDQRRTQSEGGEALLGEYHALRTAIWRFLQRSSLSGPDALATVLRVDVAIGVATIVALRAYHRSGAEPRAEAWEADLLRQVEAASRHFVDRLGGRGNP